MRLQFILQKFSLQTLLVIIFVLQWLITVAPIGLLSYHYWELEVNELAIDCHWHWHDPLGTVLLFTTGLALLSAIGVAMLTARWISQPILRLQRATQRLEQGQWQPSPGLDGRSDEIGQLARSLQRMSQRLENSLVAVQDSEKKLAQFLDALPVGVAVLEASGRSAYVNRRAQQLLGKDIVAEAITDSSAEVYRVYIAGTQQPYPSMNQPAFLALQGQSATVDNMEIHQPDKIIPIEVWATPIFDEQQQVANAIIAFQDITERKRAQAIQDRYTQDLAELNAQLEDYTRLLEHKVEERTAALAAQTQEAIRANQTKTRFLATASHDLRQPLHALRLFVEVLETRLTDETMRPLVYKIQQAVAVMASLFEALLDISRLDAGTIQPELKSFEVWNLFKPLQDEFQSAAQQKELSLYFEPCHQRIYSDPILLEQILRNLIDNAVKYTPQGEIRVSCQPVTAAESQEELEISITDTGIGIPEEQQEEVFLEFHQLHNPERDRLKGLGLGLSIVKRLALLLGHPLQLISRPGAGSRFSLKVPLSQELIDEHQVTTAAVEEEGSIEVVTAGRILVIDDELFIRTATSIQLTNWGHEVLTADSTTQALQQLATTTFLPQVIIADYRLRNNETGIEAIEAIQTYLGTKIPGIIITGDTALEPVQAAQAGEYKLLHKPVKPAHLRKLINYCLRKASG